MSTVIKVEKLSKQYRLGEVGTGALSHDLQRWWYRMRGKEDPFLRIGETNDRTKSGTSEYVWALRDINFEVNQGEVLGIIGRNGAGKSTLLKILSKTTAPTTGEIKIRGRIASLLEVGTGFHPELTGRENIFLNGAIMGMTKKEIRKKFDEIVDFAGVERYIDTPVKRYSSGMYVRLAFAVAAHLEPEILIVDEVLAVGDAEFQNKCLGKMKDVSVNEGRTILFVSHNMAAVRNLCTMGIYLVDGKVKNTGKVNEIISLYTSHFVPVNKWNGFEGNSEISIRKTSIMPLASEDLPQKDFWAIKNDLEIEIELEVNKSINEIGIGLNICNELGDPIVRCFFNDYNDIQTLVKGKYLCKFKIPKYHLATGKYNVVFDISLPSITKVHSDKINLSFELFPSGAIGNRYNADNVLSFNSLVRPDWFKELISL